MKKSIVCPNTSYDFFIDLNDVRTFLIRLETLSRLVELPILSEITTSEPFGLIKNFGVRNPLTLWLIMPLINQHAAII